MPTFLVRLQFLLCLPALLLAGHAAAAAASDTKEDPAPTVLKFSDPSKPGSLRLHVMWGEVTITGTDAKEVTIVSNIKNKETASKRSDGLRRLDSEITFSATEKNNVVSVEISGDEGGPGPNDAEFTITVPSTTSIHMDNAIGGDVTVKDVIGDTEIRSVNGEITLDHISGSALVETMNGEIHASFAKVAEGKPLSFTSMNGEIEVRIPADTKANVRMRSQNWAVLTDFDDKALVTRTEPAKGKIKVKTIRRGNGDSDLADTHAEVREAVREAIQTGVEAMREAARAAKEAAEAAREGAEAAREGVAQAKGAPIPPLPPIPPVVPSFSGGRVVSGTLNGGGADIQIATMNGSITLRKL